MIYRVEVSPLDPVDDPRGDGLVAEVAALGIPGVEGISVTDLFFLEGDLDPETVDRLVADLLVDPIIQQASWSPLEMARGVEDATVEVVLLPGVTDSEAGSLLKVAHRVGYAGLKRAASGKRYSVRGAVGVAELERVAREVLANEVIHTFAICKLQPPPLVGVEAEAPGVETIPLTSADDAGLEAISAERRLALNLVEMQGVQAYYREQEREPTDLELEMLAQTWSEHCVHKTFRAEIDYKELDADGAPVPGSEKKIDSLLRTYIKAATEEADRDWVHSAFVDNAGIVAFDDDYDLAFKLETHNHPSALEPFGGANTGIGGVVRDVMGVSARPIANTDVLCFGPQDLPHERLSDGVRHPRSIAQGVVSGIEDYGNKMGIPTVAGAMVYDEGYTANPLVYCGCIGILPVGSNPTEARPGDLVVSMGGRTGRDGLRGATFSSMEMTHETGQVAGSAVQIGHPIIEKQTLDALMVARDEGIYTAITDCGAGGFSSAVGEMGAVLGAEIHLERAPLKYPGLSPWEIWLSEAQERMVIAVPPENWDRLQEICAVEEVEVTALGAFTGDGMITVKHHDEVVGRLNADFLMNGIPRREMTATWQPPQLEAPALDGAADLGATLLELLGAPNTRSNEAVIRRYDHEVQGGTVARPLSGISNSGPADGAVIVPLEALRRDGPDAGDGRRGVALGVGINPVYSAVDPYLMAWAVVDEAVRNAVALGADPERLCLLDNFCWGNPAKPDRLAGLVRACMGSYEAAVAHRAPFVSGKDSLNNEFRGLDGKLQSIPGTLLISSLGIVPDVKKVPGADLKSMGDHLYMVGLTRGELGGSAYYRNLGFTGTGAPQPCEESPATCRAVHRVINEGLATACHDCSEGGVLLAAADMAMSGNLGLMLNLGDLPVADGAPLTLEALALGESLGRFLITVKPERAEELERILKGIPHARVGTVTGNQRLVVFDSASENVVHLPVAELSRAWTGQTLE